MCAKVIAIEAILYSEEEINVFLSTIEVEGSAGAGMQIHGNLATPSIPDDNKAEIIQERLVASGRASPDRVRHSGTAPSAPNDDEAGARGSENPEAFFVPDGMTDAKFEEWVTLSDRPLREDGGNPNMVSTLAQRAALTAAEHVFLSRDLAERNEYLASADRRERRRRLPPRHLRSYLPISPANSEDNETKRDQSPQVPEEKAEADPVSPKLKRRVSGAINPQRNATDLERFEAERHDRQVREWLQQRKSPFMANGTITSTDQILGIKVDRMRHTDAMTAYSYKCGNCPPEEEGKTGANGVEDLQQKGEWLSDEALRNRGIVPPQQ